MERRFAYHAKLGASQVISVEMVSPNWEYWPIKGPRRKVPVELYSQVTEGESLRQDECEDRKEMNQVQGW